MPAEAWTHKENHTQLAYLRDLGELTIADAWDRLERARTLRCTPT